ncbi:hypothetical protein OAV62_01910 [bacterium]|nr:hypothetical protein [bacterium]
MENYQIENICHTYEFEKEYLDRVSDDTTKELVACAANPDIPFILRLRCCEVLDCQTVSNKLLSYVLNISLPEIIKLDINSHHITNHLIYMLKHGQHPKHLEFIDKLVSSNTVARGNNAYYATRKLSQQTLPKNLPGVGTMYETLQIRIPNNYTKMALESFLYKNTLALNFLVPTLQLFHRQNILTPETCEFAMTLADANPRLQADVADFFYHTFTNEHRRYQIYIDYAQQQFRRNDILLGSQNVHILDTQRSNMLHWLVEKSRNYVPKDADDVRAFLKTLKQTSALNRIYDDNTDLVYTEHGTQSSLTLQEIFLRICHIIINHPDKSSLTIRLKEELTDMAGTCFSGHLNRLFNVFMGFEDVVQANMEHEWGRKSSMLLKYIYVEANTVDQENIMDLLAGEENLDALEYIKLMLPAIRQTLVDEFDNHFTKKEFDNMFITKVNTFFGTGVL